jgi:hypothetical protein
MNEACGCIYIDADCSCDDFQTADIRKARKEHKCCACRRVIQPGEEYERVFGVWDADPATYKTCQDCLSLREVFFCESYYYTSIWSDFEYHVHEMLGEISSSCLTSLTKRARDKACDIIEQYWEEADDE